MFAQVPPTRGNFGTNPAAVLPNYAAQGPTYWQVFVQHPDMVNGNVANFRYIFAAAGLAAAYHWVAGAGLPDAAANAAALKGLIITEACFISASLIAAGNDVIQSRKIALLVAAARRAMRRAWGFIAGDIEATQQVEVVVAGVGVVAPSLNAAGVLTNDIVGMCTDVQFNTERALLEVMWVDAVDDYIARAMRIGVGMPVAAGVCLIASGGHHFVDPHKATARGAIKQVLGGRVTSDWDLPVEVYEDALGHKAAHPVRGGVAMFLARSPATKARLVAVGLSAIGIRLPARFSPQRSADAIANVVHRAREAMAPANVAVDVAPVTALTTAVDAAVANPDFVRGIQDADALLTTFKGRHGGDVAWCAGYLQALYAATDIPRNLQTAVTAYSIQGIIRDNAAMAAMGVAHHANFTRWERARAREGFLAGAGLFGAAAPADRGPPAVGAGGARVAGVAAGPAGAAGAGP